MSRKKRKQQDESVDFSLIAADIIESPVEEFVSDMYLPFAHYVIRDRALVSDDGLKPVNRRLLYAMHQMKLSHLDSHLKANTIVGETMGRYHPHGNTSIEAALARMGQIHNMRVPIIDAQGAIGKVPGSVPASGRYWEARLTPAGTALVEELDDGVTTLIPTYDDTGFEPTSMPIRWPQVIINGTQGIAVGYASTIFPHNPTEVMNAVKALIRNQDLSIDEILKIMPGPDFPTGGVMVGVEGVKDYYETGSGSITLRGSYEITPLPRGQTAISFFEVPYQVSAESVKIDVDKARKRDKLKGLASQPKDLSGKDGLHIQFIVKSGANVVQTLREIFQYTSLESKFSANMTVLHGGVPKVTPIIGIMKQFIALRQVAVVARTESKLNKVIERIERNEGLIKVIVDIDKAIDIIRKSESSEEAQAKLMKAFKVNDEQATYVLSMPLRRLTKSDKLELENNIKSLKDDRFRYETILSSDETINEEIIADIEETSKIIADERRTTIITASAEELAEEAKAQRQEIKQASKETPCFITQFADKTVIKTVEPFEQGARGAIPIISQFETSSHDTILTIMKDGTAGRIPTTYIHEEASSLSVTGYSDNSVIGFGVENLVNGAIGTLIATSKGSVNIVNGGFPQMNDFSIVKLDEGEEVIYAQPLYEEDLTKSIVMVSEDGQVAYFGVDEIRTSNSGAGTVRGMITDNSIVGVSVINVTDESILVSCTHATIKVTPMSDIAVRKRGAKGLRLHALEKDDTVITAFAGTPVIATKNDRGIRLPEETPRATKGSNRSGEGVILGHLNYKKGA